MQAQRVGPIGVALHGATPVGAQAMVTHRIAHEVRLAIGDREQAEGDFRDRHRDHEADERDGRARGPGCHAVSPSICSAWSRR